MANSLVCGETGEVEVLWVDGSRALGCGGVGGVDDDDVVFSLAVGLDGVRVMSLV